MCNIEELENVIEMEIDPNLLSDIILNIPKPFHTTMMKSGESKKKKASARN